MSRILHTGLNAGKGPVTTVVGGQGVYFHLDDGRCVIDGSNTGGPLGHRHPAMVEAVQRAAAQAPVINEGWRYAEREKAAEDLIDIAFDGEHDWVGAVRFFLSGSEANDLALSFAQAWTGRVALATRERAYHGMTGLALHMTVQPHWHGGIAVTEGKSRPVPATVPVRQLPAPVHATFGGDPEPPEPADLLADAETTLADVAATIIDYSQGGIYYSPAYQDRVAEAARNAGSLWIADEVVTGLGRSGRWFAFQGADSRPDIVTLGKPLAGGAAGAGAVVFSKAIVDAMDDKSWQTYSTFRGHPITAAAIRAYLRVVQEEGLLDRVRELEGTLRERLCDIAASHPSVARVDGYGLHWTIELHGPDWREWEVNSAETPIASRVAERALEAGALIGTSGEQTSLFIAPPLIISDAELESLLTALDVGLSVADAEKAA